ncbi:protein kintoun [Pagrus major]|uniref:protein kintoun n=1 Tax=Pagrus major TaxID=143350 RepID=UPI003CC8CF34
MEVEDKLKELNLSVDEIDRFTQAFKDEKFREMLRDYAEELSDPENKKRYEEEIKLLEQERGNTIEFIHPEPFRVLRTSVNAKQKCFINICANDKVGKPASEWGVSKEGRRGQCWSLPHSLHPGRLDTDSKGNKIMIFDVIFHPDTLHIASKNRRFMDMVDSTAIQGIQDAFNVTLDKNNVREMKTKYKGTPQPCVIRRAIPGHKAKEPSEKPDPLAFPYPDDKTATASSQTNPSSDAEPKSFQIQPRKTIEPTKPNYTVKYRSFIDLQDFRCSRDSAQSPRPKAIVVTIDVPLLKAVTDASLEVKERQLLLECKKPAYKLELSLAYPVDEDKGEAKFNKQRGQLTVTLPVIPSKADFDTDVGPAQTSDDERQEEKSENEGLRSEEQRGVEEEEEIETKEEDLKQQQRIEKGEEEEVRGQEKEEQMKEEEEETGVEEEPKWKKQTHRGQESVEEEKVKKQEWDTVDLDVSAEENSCVATPETENQPVLVTAEHPSCTVREGEDNLNEETEKTKDSLNGDPKVETDATFSKAASPIPADTQSQNNVNDCYISTGAEQSGKMPSRGESGRAVNLCSEEPATESEKQEETENINEDDLLTEQILQKHDKHKPPPVLLREIDEDGNETVISDHSTSARFTFQNSLMYELD